VNPPRGLIVIGGLSIAFGIFVLGVAGWLGCSTIGSAHRTVFFVRNLCIFGAAFGAAPIALGAGLLALRSWSRRLTMAYAVGVGIVIAASYADAASRGYGGPSWSIMVLPLAWCAAVIAYLRQASVNALFQPPGH
jgi:hypothetical protein